MRKKKLLWIAPLAIVAMVVFIAIGGEVIMLLWNWLLPKLFAFRQITFWQALGLLVLCRILFGGLGIRGSHRSHMRRRMEERMSERWEKMTPEEREKWRQSFRGRCGPFEPPRAEPTA